MTAIRVIFDGKAFIPQEPVSLPTQSEGFVIVGENDLVARERLDAAMRAYYKGLHGGGDVEDEAWVKATSPQSRRPWDED
jgi:hypothetical protein